MSDIMCVLLTQMMFLTASIVQALLIARSLLEPEVAFALRLNAKKRARCTQHHGSFRLILLILNSHQSERS